MPGGKPVRRVLRNAWPANELHQKLRTQLPKIDLAIPRLVPFLPEACETAAEMRPFFGPSGFGCERRKTAAGVAPLGGGLPPQARLQRGRPSTLHPKPEEPFFLHRGHRAADRVFGCPSVPEQVFHAAERPPGGVSYAT